ncbi:zf-HC2 domain-containing protein [Streptomyces sp. NPDC059766]|uniref:anti-sigma factor family protein n=1 Tax=Streptomyces sp. NPDC059766 TaxID=3346940 RepID=UPI003663E3E2
MSGSRPIPAEGLLAEQHLGDRLSALVDGELGHDARERVLAHVATCPKCKSEVDAQRRLKNVFAEVAPPPPSESFLARLQGLPGCDPGDGPAPLGGGGFGGFAGRASGGFAGRAGVFGVRREDPFDFDFVPSGDHGSVLPPASPDRGFRIHPVGRGEAERSASRGRRFAFVAAGAVSLAAVALGGVTSGTPSGTAAEARGGSGNGSNVTPARTPGTSSAGVSEGQRRRGYGPLIGQGRTGTSGQAPLAPPGSAAPLLPGAAEDVVHTLTTPVVAGVAAMSPLIRPLTAATPIALTAWSSAPEVTAPGLLAAPVPTPSATPSASASTR